MSLFTGFTNQTKSATRVATGDTDRVLTQAGGGGGGGGGGGKLLFILTAHFYHYINVPLDSFMSAMCK